MARTKVVPANCWKCNWTGGIYAKNKISFTFNNCNEHKPYFKGEFDKKKENK